MTLLVCNTNKASCQFFQSDWWLVRFSEINLVYLTQCIFSLGVAHFLIPSATCQKLEVTQTYRIAEFVMLILLIRKWPEPLNDASHCLNLSFCVNFACSPCAFITALASCETPNMCLLFNWELDLRADGCLFLCVAPVMDWQTFPGITPALSQCQLV